MESVSVIITSHNSATVLPGAIDSVIGQTAAPAEVIIVDDHSTDNTIEVIKAYGDRLTTVNLDNGHGPYAARFAGIEAASDNRWVTFVDADDRLAPNAIEQALRTARRSRADIVQMKVNRRSRRWGIGLPMPLGYDPADALRATVSDERLFPVQCWGKLYRLSLIKPIATRHISYNGVWAEDRLFNLQLLVDNPGTVIATAPKAVYRYYTGGMTTKPRDLAAEMCQVRALKRGYLNAAGLLNDATAQAIDEELSRLTRYNASRLINAGVTETEVKASIRLAATQPGLTTTIDADATYQGQRRSVSRRVKRIINRLLEL